MKKVLRVIGAGYGHPCVVLYEADKANAKVAVRIVGQ